MDNIAENGIEHTHQNNTSGVCRSTPNGQQLLHKEERQTNDCYMERQEERESEPNDGWRTRETSRTSVLVEGGRHNNTAATLNDDTTRTSKSSMSVAKSLTRVLALLILALLMAGLLSVPIVLFELRPTSVSFYFIFIT